MTEDCTGDSLWTNRASHSRNRDMRSVGGSLARNLAGVQKSGRQLRDLGRDVQQREGIQDLQPLAGCCRVPGTHFVEDKLRDIDVENRPEACPTSLV